jgi:uncharacterized protein YjdB
MAKDNDSIRLRMGRYDVPSFHIANKSLLIEGGYFGFDNSDGRPAFNKFSSEQAYSHLTSGRNARVLTLRSSKNPITVVLKSVGVEGGNATQDIDSPGCGGGIFVGNNVTLKLAGCTEVTKNIASTGNLTPSDNTPPRDGKGGGIYVETGGKVELEAAVRIADNVALESSVNIQNNLTGKGGGIYSEGTLILSDSVIFERNAATNSLSSGSYGGAIYNKGELHLGGKKPSLFVDNHATAFSGNTGTALGGGIYQDEEVLNNIGLWNQFPLKSVGPVFFGSGNRARPTDGPVVDYAHPFNTLNFPTSMPEVAELKIRPLYGNEQDVPLIVPPNGSSYVVAHIADPSFGYREEGAGETFRVELHAIGRRDLHRGRMQLYANDAPLNCTEDWVDGKLRVYQVPLNKQTGDVTLRSSNFEWPAVFRLQDVLESANTKFSYEHNGVKHLVSGATVTDTAWFTHGSALKFTVEVDLVNAPHADEYFVVTNGLIIDRSNSKIARPVGTGKYEYTLPMNVARDVFVATALETVKVMFFAPAPGVSFIFDGNEFDFEGKSDSTLTLFYGSPLTFTLRHDDANFFPPDLLSQDEVVLNPTSWAVANDRVYTITPLLDTKIRIGALQARSEYASLTIDPLVRKWLPKNDKLYLSYTVKSPHLVNTKWTSSDETIAKVSVMPGSTLLCVTSFDKTGTVTITGTVEGQPSVSDAVTLEVHDLKNIPVYLLEGMEHQLEPSQKVDGGYWRLLIGKTSEYITLSPEGAVEAVHAGGPIEVVYVSKVVVANEIVEFIWETVSVTVYSMERGKEDEVVLMEGDTYPLQVHFDNEDVNKLPLEWQWTIDDPAVAVIENNSTLRAVHYGKVRATATAGLAYYMRDFYVARVVLNKEAESISVGDTTVFDVTVFPESMPDRRISWSVSHASIATITGSTDAGARVVLHSAGDASVQAALTAAPRVKATCSLTTLGRVSVQGAPQLVNVGETFSLTAKLEPWLPEVGILEWESLTPGTAEVNQMGTVKTLAPGVATIRVTAQYNPALTASVTIDVVQVSIEAPKKMFGFNSMGTMTIRVIGGNKNTTDKEWPLTLSPLRDDIMHLDSFAIARQVKRQGAANAPDTASVTVYIATMETAGSVTLTAQVAGYPTTQATIAMQAVELQLPMTQIIVDKGDSPFSLMPHITPGNVLWWRSTNSGVASVLAHEGRVTPLSAGTTFIVAELYENATDAEPVLSASCEVTVVDAPLALQSRYDIVLPAVVEMGKGYPLKATKDGIPVSTFVQWTTKTPGIIEVNSNASWMKALNPGTASLRMVVDGVVKERTFEVSVTEAGIRMTDNMVTLDEGASTNIRYTLLPEGYHYGTIAWASDNSQAASVDHNGLVSALSQGEAIITATLYLPNSTVADIASCKVKVVAREANFTLSATSYTMTQGETFALNVQTLPPYIDFGRAYIESNNPAVASVETYPGQPNRVTVRGNNGGTATLKAYVSGIPDVVRYCQVTVEAQATEIILNYKDLTLPVGKTATVLGWIRPHTAKQAYTLTSTYPKIATVSSDGTITALSEGTTTITAVTSNGRSATVTVHVTPEVTKTAKLTLSDTVLSLVKGQRYTLLAYAPDKGSVTWSVDAPAVGLIDGGLLRAVASGKATVTATDSYGNTASCVVSVNVFAERLSVYPYRPKVLLVGEEFTANVVFDPSDVLLHEVTWMVDNAGVVDLTRVNAQTCKISGVYPGITLLSVLSADGKASSQWLLTVIQPTTLDVEPEPEVLPPSASYFAGYLRLKNMAGYRATLTTMSGRSIGIFSVASDDEDHPLTLPPGIYILTATHNDTRFVTKFVVR